MNTKVKIAGVELKNPVMTASGTFGSGEEYSEFVDLNKLGAVVTKGVANVPWEGNPTPRIAETSSGMLNAIGLQNPGVDVFCKRDLPFLQKFDTKIIVNVCGHAPEEYLEVAERLSEENDRSDGDQYFLPECKRWISGLWTGCFPCGETDRADQTDRRTSGDHEADAQCNRYYRDRQSGGSGRGRRGLSDQYADRNEDRCKPKDICPGKPDGRIVRPGDQARGRSDGLSGCPAVKIPVIGMGGIASTEDALEFLLAGATAVAVGTANFRNPRKRRKSQME